ncbi:MAG: transporter substrate-binding domain-containing protein, partial [Deltaproteobacteria bacterium]|nr:transporter substrate-binding domain-containing protein [Deltaproteobacteria bacterium]
MSKYKLPGFFPQLFINKWIILVILGAFMCLFPPGSSGRTADQPIPFYTDYRRIPGVTQEDIEAIEAIRADRSSFVFALNPSIEMFVDDSGSMGGFSALLCRWLSQLFGIPFVPQSMEWGPMIEGLANGSVDFSSDLTANPERRKTYFMTDAVAERSVKYFRLMGAMDLDIISTQRMRRYIFLEGTLTHKQVEENSQEPFEALTVVDYDEAYLMLKSGRADAFFDEGIAEAAFEDYGDIQAFDFFPLIYSPVSLATQQPQLEPVIRVVQKALDAGVIRHLVELYNQGEKDYHRHRFISRLTAEEAAYLQNMIHSGQSVQLAAEYDNYPVSFYNREEKQWQGISFDVLEAVTEISGLKFEIANHSLEEWPDIMENLEKGRYQMVTELIWSTDRENRFLWTRTPYMVDNYALLSLRESQTFRINEILYLKIGLVADTAFMELFQNWFPNHPNTVVYVNTLDAFNGLERGEVDLLMATRNLLLSMTNYMERPEFKTNIVFNYRFNSTFGFNINETVLASIVSKAIVMIDTGSISGSWTGRTFDYRGKLARSRVPWLIGFTLALFSLLFLSIFMLIRRHQVNQRLENLVGSRTRELETQKAAALEASRAKGDFLAQMSHEIRTPMNAIIGMAELALREKIPEEVEEMITSISQAGASLLSIINDILDFSKIESGRMELHEEPYQTGDLLTEAIEAIKPRLAGRPVVFLVEAESFLPETLIGDEVRLRQILLNILSNAAKYTREGHITLGAAAAVRDQDVTLSLTVSDTGLGIRPEDKEKLFANFTRFDNSLNKGVEGTGLGLAITLNLAKLMGGELTVESEYQKGSVFKITVLQKLIEYRPLARLDSSAGRFLVQESDPLKASSLEFTLKSLTASYDLVPEINETVLKAAQYKYILAPENQLEMIRSLTVRLGLDPKIILMTDQAKLTRIENYTLLHWPIFCQPLVRALEQTKTKIRRKAASYAFTAPSAHILVVDDIEMNLKVARGLLKPFQAQVDTCDSGQAAVDLVGEKQYDLIVMDHPLPGLDGLEATTQIRRLAGGQDVPIIALTANAVSGVKEMFIENGMNDFISKPIDPVRLESVLSQWLPTNKM